MTEKWVANSENRMPTADIADTPRAWLEAIAGERRPAESIKAMLLREARAAGLPAGRVKRIWYGEIENISWREAETIRRRAQEETRRRWEIMAQRKSLAEWKTDLERTRENAAEIGRRHDAFWSITGDGKGGADNQQLVFWLGRDDPGVD